MRTLWLMCWAGLAGLVLFSSEAWALPVQDATSLAQKTRQLGKNISRQALDAKRQAQRMQKAKVLGLRWLAQAEGEKQEGQNDPIPGGQWPVGAWVLEGVGAAVIAGGLVCFALSAGRITTRDKLIKEANDDIKNEGTSNVAAVDIKKAEDDGMALNTAGWIVTGVGVGLVVIGAIWMFVHQPPKAKYVRRDIPASSSPTMAHNTKLFSKGAAAPALLLRAGM